MIGRICCDPCRCVLWQCHPLKGREWHGCQRLLWEKLEGASCRAVLPRCCHSSARAEPGPQPRHWELRVPEEPSQGLPPAPKSVNHCFACGHSLGVGVTINFPSWLSADTSGGCGLGPGRVPATAHSHCLPFRWLCSFPLPAMEIIFSQA